MDISPSVHSRSDLWHLAQGRPPSHDSLREPGKFQFGSERRPRLLTALETCCGCLDPLASWFFHQLVITRVKCSYGAQMAIGYWEGEPTGTGSLTRRAFFRQCVSRRISEWVSRRALNPRAALPYTKSGACRNTNIGWHTSWTICPDGNVVHGMQEPGRKA